MAANQSPGNYYKIGFFVFAAIFLFLAGILTSNLLKGKPSSQENYPSPTKSYEEIITLPPTDIPPTSIPAVTKVEQTAEQGIKEAFAQKYAKNITDVTITISKNTGTHAQGGVKFAGEMAGGWFLAYKDDSGWIIVADGNGTIPCLTVAPYNFPADMVPDC
ncbi:hypothetical protein A2W14_04165 [Candidatus Gottesmanbacteria bacterium RBG_16_37_8]|uniref:Uncharacterized protein n=1 Tax=Candidatus Gottesmanbacteria bacterium RBG_16_37_8 TaxID=1798371 RepID=A0A1F5YQB7_9BACT|nr:MAG: hypothetical protein A2W14_04165 [Candidatus Gottesmanbacteria bacterium RBG_16_37_8]